MELSIAIISLGIVITFSYLATMLGSKIRIPSVVLLIALGILIRYLSNWAGLAIPELKLLISILGTIGLLLIVLEASLEIRIDRSNIGVFLQALIAALFVIGLTTTAIYTSLWILFNFQGKSVLLASIALSIMSSAVTIPSITGFDERSKLFLTLESAFSEVLGVLAFNFVQSTEEFQLSETGTFFGEIGMTVVVSLVGVVCLVWILKVNKSKIRYFAILGIVLIMYGIGKLYHLPVLVLIVFFGLFLANFPKIREKIRWRFVKGIDLDQEVQRFEEMNNEISFIVRTFFFVVFGMQLDLFRLASIRSIQIELVILPIMYLSRSMAILPLARTNLGKIVLTAPRGLITILLFYQIVFLPSEARLVDIMYISIIASVLIMTFVVLFSRDSSRSDI